VKTEKLGLGQAGDSNSERGWIATLGLLQAAGVKLPLGHTTSPSKKSVQRKLEENKPL